MPVATELCGCGQPLHYTDPQVQADIQALVDRLGPTMPVTAPGGSWLVPRHYIALHGLTAVQLPELAARYGWEHA